MTPISGISIPLTMPPGMGQIGEASKGGPAFKNVLLEGLDQVNNLQQDADKAVEQMFIGGDVNPAEVLTAVQKADMAFRLMMQVRNKLIAAYQEIKDVRI